MSTPAKGGSNPPGLNCARVRREVINRITRFRREFLLHTGVEPTPEVLTAKGGVSVERLAELETCSKEAVSLHTAGSDASGTEFGDFIVDSDSLSPWDVVAWASFGKRSRASWRR